MILVIPEIFPYQPFDSISNYSVAHFSTDSYTEPCMTYRVITPHDDKMRGMETSAGIRQKQKFRPFSQALAFAE